MKIQGGLRWALFVFFFIFIFIPFWKSLMRSTLKGQDVGEEKVEEENRLYISLDAREENSVVRSGEDGQTSPTAAVICSGLERQD